MGAENVGREVKWKVNNLEGGKNEVTGKILAYVPERTLLTAALLAAPTRARGSVRKGIKDRSAIARYAVEVLERREGGGLTPRLYVPNAGAIDLALEAARITAELGSCRVAGDGRA